VILRERVLIAGCGYVGTTLGLGLAAAGDEVFGLRRSPTGLPSAIRPVAADLAGDPAALAEALPLGIDAIVYCAAADGPGEDAYRAAYVTGVERLLAALEGRGRRPRRLVYTSSTSVYAQDDGSWVDETTPATAITPTARALLDCERAVLEGTVPAVVLRLAGIYGPGRSRLIEAVRSGRATIDDDGPPAWTNRIHRDDAAGAIAHLLRLERPDRVYIGADARPAPQQEVTAWIAERLGAPRPPSAARASGGSRDLRGSKRCSSGRLLASGYVLRFPSYREGYAALLE